MTFIGVLVLYLLMVVGTGDGGTFGYLFHWEELVAGVVLSLIAAAIARAMLGKAENSKLFFRFPLFLVYLPIWFAALTKANIDVAVMVITGKIKPGIVKIDPGLKTNLGKTILANSITLTPGTLTVDLWDDRDEMYIHWINVKETKTMEERIKGVCGSFAKWARRLAE
jgi:multicomponent Na+:H+ antiporter subunit E